MGKVHVAVFTPQYFPDYGPSVPIYTSLCEDLIKFGYEVSVITSFPHNDNNNRKHSYRKNIVFKEEINGVKVIRTFVYRVPKNSRWRRLIYHGSQNLFFTLASFGMNEIDVIIADAPTLWSGLPLLIKAILAHVPYIYVVHDIFPDVLHQLGMVPNESLINTIGRIEKFYYQNAAKISVLSQGFKDNLISKGIEENKLEIIPACVDINSLKPLSKHNKIREKWDLTEKFVVLYAGNFGFTQGIDQILDAASILKSYNEIIFLLVGDGAEKNHLQHKIETGYSNNVRMYPFLPQEDVPYLYACSDVCLVTLKKNIAVESVPSKTYTIMASGRPIIASVNTRSEVCLLVQNFRCGIWVEPENPLALAEAILSLYQDPEIAGEMGIRGREAAVTNFSRKVAANKYHQLILESVNGNLSAG